MIGAAVGLLALKAGAMAIPEKTLFVGLYIAKARLAAVNAAASEIKVLMKSKRIAHKAGVALLNSAKLLKKTAKDGWSSKEELEAFGAVCAGLANYESAIAATYVKEKASEVGKTVHQFGVAAEQAVGGAIQNIRERF